MYNNYIKLKYIFLIFKINNGIFNATNFFFIDLNNTYTDDKLR